MKRIFKLIPLALILGISPYINAQSVASLEIMPDAKSLGMANATMGLKGDAASVYKNTSAISFSDSYTGVGYTYADWYGKNNLHSLSVFYTLNKKHTFALGMRYFDGQKVSNSPDGITIDYVNPYDMSLDLGYAYRLDENWSASVNARYVHSKINEGPGVKRANVFAADLGISYHNDQLGAGVSITNLGTKADYGYGKYDLPTSLNFGAAYHVVCAEVHQITGSIEGNYRFLPSDYSTFGAGVGADYTYAGMFSVRGGYHVGDKKKGPGSYGVIGCGVDLGHVAANFAYVLAKHDNILRDVWQVSIGFNF